MSRQSHEGRHINENLLCMIEKGQSSVCLPHPSPSPLAIPGHAGRVYSAAMREADDGTISHRPEHPSDDGRGTGQDAAGGIRRTRRLSVAAALALLALWVARDYLVALAWAVLIAVAAWPLYCRFAAAMP